MTAFWETMLPPTLRGKIFYNFFKTCAKYGQDPVQDFDQEQKLFKSRNRNRNKALRFANTNELKTETGSEHYMSLFSFASVCYKL